MKIVKNKREKVNQRGEERGYLPLKQVKIIKNYYISHIINGIFYKIEVKNRQIFEIVLRNFE